MHRIEKDWSPLVDTIVANSDAESVAEAVKELKESLTAVAPIFAEKPFFMSDEFTLVDCCLAPMLWRLEHFGVKLPNTRQTKPLHDYMSRLFERESFQESLTEQEREMRS